MKPLKAPFPWFGGKSRAAELIWSRFGNPRHYIEAFAGSLAALLQRPTAPQLETVNDLDALLANFWRAVAADPVAVAGYADWPISEPDLHSRHRWLVEQLDNGFRELMLTDPHHFDAKIAGWWVWGLSCWIGGGWCSGLSSWNGKPFTDGEAVHQRKPHLMQHGAGGKGVHRSLPDLAGKANPGGRGVHQGLHRQRPQLNHGGGGGDGRGVHRRLHLQRPHLSTNVGGMAVQKRPALPGNGVHAKRPHLSTNVGGKGVHRRRPGPNNSGGRAGTVARQGEALVEWFEGLQERLRRVRVCCGDWSRVVTPAVLGAGGASSITAVLLDPPYSGDERAAGIYAEDSATVAAAVREWAIANGANPRLRIALCGYAGEHEMPPGWECVAWKAVGGYGSQDGPDAQRFRERVWFSPHCLRQPSLFG